jgi:hypothetical protein
LNPDEVVTRPHFADVHGQREAARRGSSFFAFGRGQTQTLRDGLSRAAADLALAAELEPRLTPDVGPYLELATRIVGFAGSEPPAATTVGEVDEKEGEQSDSAPKYVRPHTAPPSPNGPARLLRSGS